MSVPIKLTAGMVADSLMFDHCMVGIVNRGGDDRSVEFTIVAEGHALTVPLDADEARTLSDCLIGIVGRHEDLRKTIPVHTVGSIDRGR